MATFKPIAINRTGVNLPYKEGQYIVATQPFTNGGTAYEPGVYVDMLGARQQLTMRGPKGDKGETGADGATGANGAAATITIGQVSTGAPGSPAQVSNSGTEQNAVINFVIPTGADGPRGQQGAGWFHTTVQSGVTVQISSLQPQLTPQVGDGVVFSNGEVRQVIGVSGSTVTLGNVLFSFKGDPGIGDATLSNTDGDSTEDGFTQAAVKGVAQAKNYYNEGSYDKSVSNGNGTGTVTRKTGIRKYQGNEVSPGTIQYANITYFSVPKPKDYLYFGTFLTKGCITNKYPIFTPPTGGWDNADNVGKLSGSALDNVFWIGFPYGTTLAQAQQEIDGLIIEYELVPEYQYTEQVIDNQPIRPATQGECLYWHEEWNKVLNLYPNGDQISLAPPYVYLPKIDLKANTNYTVIFSNQKLVDASIRFGGDNASGISAWQVEIKSGTSWATFNLTQTQIDETIKFWFDVPDGAQGEKTTLMLVRGTHPYPYEPYYGGIVHEKDLSGVQLFPADVNPAQTIGGDWEDLGTVTVGSTTLHAYQKVNGGQ